eukprot:5890575-Ditylum_brightwellii.AAC.1
MVDYSCCWDCIGKNGKPCVEAVALCLRNNKDPHMLYPSYSTVDAGYKLANVPVIPNHCHLPKGGSGHLRKRRYENNGVLDCKKIMQNQARAEKSAVLDGDVAPPAIDSFNVMTCSTCGGKMHNRS